MLMTKETIDQLAGYLGSTPIPEDFDTFWAARMAEADQVSLDYSVSPSEIPAFDTCDYLDFWFRGMNGARLYAKYVKPRSDRPIPLVLQFHGYPGASRSWLEQSSYAGMGCALLALDCPGPGGLGDDPGGYAGTTVTGHIAKENIDGTMGILYGGSGSVYASIGAAFTGLAGYSFLAFNLLCAPCFAAIGAIKREMNSAKWTWFAIGYQCLFAYAVSLMIYQIGSVFTGNINVIGLIAALAVAAGIICMLFKPYKESTKLTTAVKVR